MPNAIPQNRLDALIAAYGEDSGGTGAVPSPAQWQALAALDPAKPVTLINYFKLAPQGNEAMMNYAAVSMPTLEKLGGRFLLTAPFAGTLMGEAEDWDMIAIGTYPEARLVFALFEDPAYREAYAHRKAACLRQKVLIAAG
jgi:uncharacterized protein (DUF1330 family)